jgi:uncharacterized membrane protein YgdD (TMEM256/DUF423 family)
MVDVMNALIILAGLMGAAGVTLAAASSHAATTVKLDSAAYLLLLHAPAVIAGINAIDRGLAWRPLGIAALVGFVVGSTLFASDLTLRAFAGNRLFPMAAPSGGVILIASWLGMSVAAAVALWRG